MKTLRKVLLVALTGMFLAGSVPAFAQYPTSMQEKTGNWLSGSTTTAPEGGGIRVRRGQLRWSRIRWAILCLRLFCFRGFIWFGGQRGGR